MFRMSEREKETTQVVRRVRIDDYAWYEVRLKDGQPTTVIKCEQLFPTRGQHTNYMNERIRRAIKAAQDQD